MESTLYIVNWYKWTKYTFNIHFPTLPRHIAVVSCFTQCSPLFIINLCYVHILCLQICCMCLYTRISILVIFCHLFFFCVDQDKICYQSIHFLYQVSSPGSCEPLVFIYKFTSNLSFATRNVYSGTSSLSWGYAHFITQWCNMKQNGIEGMTKHEYQKWL